MEEATIEKFVDDLIATPAVPAPQNRQTGQSQDEPAQR